MATEAQTGGVVKSAGVVGVFLVLFCTLSGGLWY